MCNERLTALAVLSIESEVVKSIKHFNEIVIDKFANAKTRKMDFIFK